MAATQRGNAVSWQRRYHGPMKPSSSASVPRLPTAEAEREAKRPAEQMFLLGLFFAGMALLCAALTLSTSASPKQKELPLVTSRT